MEDQFTQEFEDELFGADDPAIVESTQVTENEFLPDNQATELVEDPKAENDAITRLLKAKGIDRNNVQFQNENGDIEQWNWDDLDEEDKYAILSQQEDSPITDNELNTLNYLRLNNMSLQDFAEWQRSEAIKDYLSQNQTPSYEMDKLSDEEVFAYDLMLRFGESISDEEIDNQLARAKEDPDMFAKTVGLLRNQYKKVEDEKTQATLTQQEEQKKAEFNELVDSLVNAAQNVQEIQGVELEDEDREKILDFLLKENPQGRTGFSQLLSDPDMIFKMAWFALYGEETFNSTVDYFQKKLAEARRGSQPQSQKPKVIKKTKTQKEFDPYGLDDVF